MLVLYYPGFKIYTGKAENFGKPAGKRIKMRLLREVL
jgi:hypothetical protein